MNKQEYLDFCRDMPGAALDQPFNEDFDTWIARHADTGKWFAAVLRHESRDFVNLKCDPVESEFLQSVYDGVTPGYHMNKTHWISVYFDADVPDGLICRLTQESFRLTGRRKRKQVKENRYGKPERNALGNADDGGIAGS